MGQLCLTLSSSDIQINEHYEAVVRIYIEEVSTTLHSFNISMLYKKLQKSI